MNGLDPRVRRILGSCEFRLEQLIRAGQVARKLRIELASQHVLVTPLGLCPGNFAKNEETN
jgi:hypothetical protein